MISLRKKHGISLPLAIGLVVILMIAAITVHQIILQSLRSARRIEAADRAFFAAEAGVENALYELSPHFAGYETPELDDADVRTYTFDDSASVNWVNNWKISNIDADGVYTGNLYENQKLIVNLFQDTSGSPIAPVEDKAINTAPDAGDISQIDVSTDLNITFRIPYDGDGAYTQAFNGNELLINNDGDDDLNEDGEDDFSIAGVCDPVLILDDADCDGRDDEDSEEDVVIYWKITDDEGRTLVAIPGCFLDGGSEICEKDFALGIDHIEFALNWTDSGVAHGGGVEGATPTIGEFIESGYDSRDPNAKIFIEFLVVAPLIQDTGPAGGSLVREIPYLEYEVYSGGSTALPLPVYSINSDGWYQDFKQSILTQIYPKENVPLLDITIIQQQ